MTQYFSSFSDENNRVIENGEKGEDNKFDNSFALGENKNKNDIKLLVDGKWDEDDEKIFSADKSENKPDIKEEFSTADEVLNHNNISNDSVILSSLADNQDLKKQDEDASGIKKEEDLNDFLVINEFIDKNKNFDTISHNEEHKDFEENTTLPIEEQSMILDENIDGLSINEIQSSPKELDYSEENAQVVDHEEKIKRVRKWDVDENYEGSDQSEKCSFFFFFCK
jgi:hypothetical protein